MFRFALRTQTLWLSGAALTCLSLPMLTSPTLASEVPLGHAGDIGITIDNGKLVTSIIAEDDDGGGGGGGAPTFTASRIFQTALGPAGIEDPDEGAAGLPADVLDAFPQVRFIANTPGLDAVPGTFNAGVNNTLTLPTRLQVWNGSAFVDTTATTNANGETVPAAYMQASYASDAAVTLDAFNSSFTQSVTLPVAGGADVGEWHRHFTWALFPNNGVDPDTDILAPQGVYLLELQLSTDQPGIAASDPFYIVFNDGMDNAVANAAADWVQTNLVPEPTSLALLGLGGAAGLLRRRGARIS